jgi:thiamine-phosphate pyrophosphorylase
MDRTALIRRLRLYVITDGHKAQMERVSEALEAGVTAMQLRAKEGSTRALVQMGQTLAATCRRRGALFIVNDRLDVALACGADGVHLGLDDLPLPAARAIAGPNLVIGASVGTVGEALEAQAQGADYLGVGSVFHTLSKADAGPPIGMEGLRQVAQATPLPVVAIGGITVENAAFTLSSGAVGVAVIRAVWDAP